ncbi:hypothetical protein K2173_001573 [Erythroxylum novogranatense]|uniref:Pentatricopeptide repeat-containing protein n=1 Tax=Erythroxylum novogranatense TaxID=1862640 RepID=A0AAV8T3W3_9ROSI|nr:hypothetical protein K2173_001573 [Erythroxylum novogranatense]
MNMLSKTLTYYQNAFFSRFYYTYRTKKVTLYSKISPLGDPKISVVPELDNWLDSGQKIRFAELQRIIRDLRRRNRFTQALEVSEWMNNKGLCIFSHSEHAVQLDLIGRVRGYASAEIYFNSLRDKDKTDKTYGALLNCYVRQRQTDKSIAHLQKMKELGFAFSPLTYNNIMCLYTYLDQHEKVPHVLKEMKENSVSPDNFSYRICINSYGARSDIEGMQPILNEMERQPHIVMDWNTYAVVANFYIKANLADKAIEALRKSEERLCKKDGTGYHHLITLYATLGIKSEVLRLWNLEKSDCKRSINRDFINVVESLMKLDAFEDAENIMKEWESSGNCYDFRIPNAIIIGYSRKGLYAKAEALLRDLMEKGKATDPKSWGTLAAGYLDRGEVMKAFNCMNTALSVRVKGKRWSPNPVVITGALSWLGDEGSAEDAEAVFTSLKGVIPMTREIYHALLKAYIRGGKEVHQLLEQMRTDKIDEDDETKKILAMRKK